MANIISGNCVVTTYNLGNFTPNQTINSPIPLNYGGQLDPTPPNCFGYVPIP